MRATFTSANFGFLAKHDAQLVRLGALAERYLKDDPATSLIKLRQFGETLAQLVAAKAGLFQDVHEPQADLLRRLKFDRVLPRDVGELFHHCFITSDWRETERLTKTTQATAKRSALLRWPVNSESGSIAPLMQRRHSHPEHSCRLRTPRPQQTNLKRSWFA